MPAELAAAEALGLARYHPRLLNKYDIPAVQVLPGPYHFIIDVNPTGYACCLGHLEAMWLAYRDQLAKDGLIVTACYGLEYQVKGDEAHGLHVEAHGSAMTFGFAFKQNDLAAFLLPLGMTMQLAPGRERELILISAAS